MCIYIGGVATEEEDTSTLCDLSDCLSFFTGASIIRPTCFDTECTLNLTQLTYIQQHLPVPSHLLCQQCSMINILHRVKLMLFAFKNNGGFGLY